MALVTCASRKPPARLKHINCPSPTCTWWGLLPASHFPSHNCFVHISGVILQRITGISFSGNLFFLKLGLAIVGAMVGFLLSWYGYDPGAKAQSDSAINGIMLLFTIIPGVGYLITAGVVRLLKVDREFMQKIQSDLEKRRDNYRELNEYHKIKTTETVRKA